MSDVLLWVSMGGLVAFLVGMLWCLLFASPENVEEPTSRRIPDRVMTAALDATPENVEEPTCGFCGDLGHHPNGDASHVCPECNGEPENVEEPTGCIWCKGRSLPDHDCRNFKQFGPEDMRM